MKRPEKNRKEKTKRKRKAREIRKKGITKNQDMLPTS